MDVHVRVNNAEGFWQGMTTSLERPGLMYVEVEAILQVPDAPTLTMLDNTLRMFVTFCAAYHGELR